MTTPRVVMIPDTSDWAFYNIARQVQNHLVNSYDVRIVPADEFEDGAHCLRHVLQAHDPSLIHFFWREQLFHLLRMDLRGTWAHRYDAAQQSIERVAAAAITTSVYDHLYCDAESLERRASLFAFADAYCTSSVRLHDIYSRSAAPAPDLVIEDGVDLGLFRPGDRAATADTRGPFVIGWAGNSAWRRTATQDPKGLHSLIRPAVEALRARGYAAVGQYADRYERLLPHDEMPVFYRGLDVYVCASESEGTPNPVLEAMACGVPVISTDVGVVPQVFGPEQARFIVAARTVDCLVEKLLELLDNPALRRRLGEENRARIGRWSWQRQTREWAHFFAIALAKLDARNVLRKRFILEGSPLVSEAIRMRRAALERPDAIRRAELAAEGGRGRAVR